MAEERRKKPLRERIVYYPVEEETEKVEEVITPKPLRQTLPLQRPHIFPIIGALIDLILSVIEARRQSIESLYRPAAPTPKKFIREVVRDEYGRIISEEFTSY
jgi:hypothetical protein